MACGVATGPTGRSTVAAADPGRCMGARYEIARFEIRFEKKLSDVQARYSLRPDGRIEVENSGTDIRSGKRRTVRGKAHAGRGPGRLRIPFSGFPLGSQHPGAGRRLRPAGGQPPARIPPDSFAHARAFHSEDTPGRILQSARRRDYVPRKTIFTGRQTTPERSATW